MTKKKLEIVENPLVNVLFNDEIIDLKYNDYNQIVMATNSKIIKLFDRASNKYRLLYGNSDIILCCDCK